MSTADTLLILMNQHALLRVASFHTNTDFESALVDERLTDTATRIIALKMQLEREHDDTVRTSYGMGPLR